MKKLIFVCLFVIVLMTSCCSNDYYMARATFDVCYPDTTIYYDSVFVCSTDGPEDTIVVGGRTESYRGTNMIRIDPGYNVVMRTTAPIRLHNVEFKGRIEK